MKENKNPFDEYIQSRLIDFESPVPMDLFDHLQARRGGGLPSDATLRERLEGHASPVPMDLFDRLQAQRGGVLPSDAALRERLEEHESPVSDEVFDNIRAERQRRNRRVWLWRSAMAIAALWLLGIVMVQLKNKNTASNIGNGMSDVEKSTTSGISANETNKNAANTEGVSDVENRMSDVKKSATSGISANETNKSASNTEGGGDVGNRMSAVRKSATSGISVNETNKSALNTEGVSDVENRMSDVGKSGILGISANKTNKNASNTEGVVETAISMTFDITNPKNTEGASDVENGISDFGKLLTSDITNLRLNNRMVASFDLLNIKTPQILMLKNEARKNPCSNPDNGCPTFGLRRRGMGESAFYVDAFVAPEYIVRSFIKNLPESEKLLVARDSVEKTQYAVSTGIRASFVLGNGLAIRTGAIYNQINEKARFDSLGIGTITTTYKVNSLPNGQLDTVSVIRTVTDGIFRRTRYNHYRTIDIPVQIGFEKSMNNGWGMGVNGGAVFNITAWRKANIVGADLRQLNVSSGINQPNSVFSTRLGVSLMGSIAVYRQLTDNLQFVFEPSLRYGLQPITRTDYALKQQYSTVGVLVGLRMKI